MTDKTCNTCRHWARPGYIGFACECGVLVLVPGASEATQLPPSEFGCNRWDEKPDRLGPIDRAYIERTLNVISLGPLSLTIDTESSFYAALRQWLADHPADNPE